jgi:hypothetical protein
MRQLQTDDLVQLLEDLPDLCLRKGTSGVICAKWFMPKPVYEVEFQTSDGVIPLRALLLAEQLRVVETIPAPQTAGPQTLASLEA